MIVGFNHNFRYKGETYHVQTEDGGLKSPHIITLLYSGGTILASRKTSYADILRADNLEAVVEELMKEQHREMLRRLKDGEFDEVIAGRRAAVPSPPPAAPDPPPQPPAAAPASSPAEAADPAPPAPAAAAVRPSLPAGRQEPVAETSLDEIILSYLTGSDDKG